MIKIVYSDSFNPWYNLALEEYLLEQIKKDDVILYLWQNERTVVIGRNQNAWKECQVKLLEEEGGYLARRLSGGGAVYQDLGNLNFTFLLDRELYDLERQLGVILRAVKKLNIEAEFSGRNDLVVQEKKFSGNAFYFREDKAYHHGTLLVASDFEDMLKYLQVSPEKIRSKGVESVRSRVINLKELNPELTIAMMKKALEESFQEEYGQVQELELLPTTKLAALKPLYDKYSSWEWRFGRTPDFDLTLEKRFAWGGFELGLNLKKGQIEQATIFSDAMDVDLLEEIARVLEGTAFQKEAILKKLSQLQPQEIIKDLQEWLAEKIL